MMKSSQTRSSMLRPSRYSGSLRCIRKNSHHNGSIGGPQQHLVQPLNLADMFPVLLAPHPDEAAAGGGHQTATAAAAASNVSASPPPHPETNMNNIVNSTPACSSMRQLLQKDGFQPDSHGFRMYMQVRPTEVDAFGVVNNTVYPEYALHTRCSMMEALGHPVDTLLAAGIATATARMDMSFQHPLRPGDRFYCEIKLVKLMATSLTFEDRVVKLPKVAAGEAAEQLAAQSSTTCVFLDAVSYRPTRIPGTVKQALQQAFWL